MIETTDDRIVIKVDNITKKFEDKEVIKGITFDVYEGEIFGFLGPNGAGKTTIVKMLNGIINPTSGLISIVGIDPLSYPERIHALAGTLTETANMYEQMTAIENLAFFSKIFGVKEKNINKRINFILNEVGLYEDRNKLVKHYSTGMRKKLSLARTLIHNPKLLILDEPTSGLDPESAKKVNALIKNYVKRNNGTVFLCTHQLRYAQDICTRYGFIDKGKLVCSGELNEIILRNNFKKYLLLYANFDDTYKDIKKFKIDDNKYKIPIENKEEVSLIIRDIISIRGSIFEARIYEPSLEDIYFSLVNASEEYYE
ncbi:ABC transporter ATP-binding protein [Anaerococcus sp.]|uniref:ABC transporter ATP-binding protein n=1 Tax=Anaerococcus sp. TaxID=1872515 RepID=UPI001DBC1F57|nr:ABC transporter ATP-binding protein [Anaerococcus sp.]MBS6025797.1 ABC transporter ATP-binding protein [Paeniclostridium sordellii]HEQ2813179.1 ABC transporter ATP-binding protein [Streptococcus pyogenes]MBS6106910.1 ABC transporter ATP-binding protein [Anaerococcus sp.]HER9214815.1 ABC transporter ATP-binding protein [Streptococcus pyogenes]HES1179199.1 ABC transporter ATP-binding protein [Streptococcus pyogenes]